ncbi:hypothetical protein L7F22_050366 [Adiantum nelumboides]|nr:hypothetical protein [Adiantum nelumboides]
MVVHTLARLYASFLEQQLSSWAEHAGVRAKGQAGFRRGLSTLVHILTLRAIIEEGRSQGKRIYCSFVDFRKAFDTVLRARLMRRLQEMGVTTVLTWGIMALYRSVTGHVRTPEGISDLVLSTIGVKQGCPLSPTLFGMYVDEVSDYIDREGDRGAGISAESGIPTFRGEGGLWRSWSATELATPEAFAADPSLVWEFYHYRRYTHAHSCMY